MASQSELILRIDFLKAQLVDYNAQLAVYRTQGDISAIIETQTLISNTETELAEAEADLANLNVTTDPDRQQVLVEENNIEPQTEVDPNSDPNLNANEGAVDGTTEAIQRQKDLEDGTSEFAGIDTQIENNENALQEPPQLSNEEVDAYLNQLQDERIENERAADIEENVFNPGETFNAGDENVFDPTGNNGAQGALNKTRSTATNQDAVSFEKAKDWRVRLSLAPSAKYLYNAGDPGILKPLTQTNGVIFPYTPNISVVYAANYDASELVHSNYKIYNYKNSSVDTVSITCDFTAQDTTEANYLLAVIHFFRSVTKMFYGRDENPRNGTPPPLCYLSGLGTFQFDNHPLVISNFTYTLPTDVDYIRVGSQTNMPGQSVAQQTFPVNTQDSSSLARILSSGLGARTPNFQRQASTINSDASYVPTKMQIAITCIPIVTRNDISNNFSLKKYATGELLQGSKRNGGGIW